MRYGNWSNPREERGFSEKAFQRQSLPVWDARWHALSAQARQYFLKEIKGPIKRQLLSTRQPSAPSSNFPPEVLEELTKAGFVEVLNGNSKAAGGRVIACGDLIDFTARIRALQRYQLLTANQPGNLEKYVEATFYGYRLVEAALNVLIEAEMGTRIQVDTLLARYVRNRSWPDWVAESLKKPVAERILDVIRGADGPVPLAELAGRLPKDDPNDVRKAVDDLISLLALFEDLQPDTRDLMIGFLPAVIEDARRASRPRSRPPLVVVEAPREVGPDGGAVIDDLRTLLLETVSEPPRLRQDRLLFQKEEDRFKAALGPLPVWLLQTLEWTNDGRPGRTLSWARSLGLVQDVPDGKQLQLQVTSKGSNWLSGGIDNQYAAIYNMMNAPVMSRDQYNRHMIALLVENVSYVNPYVNHESCDTRFLGVPATAMATLKEKRARPYWESKPEDHTALRKALDKAFAALEPGVFYRLDSVVAHLTFDEYNPLNLGLAMNQVAVYWGSRFVPPIEEDREEGGRLLIEVFARQRLLPLGCLRAAVDDQGHIAIARQARYDAYFGRKISPSELDLAVTRVVVQPDFSVVVIGPNTAPTAELAPFCERTTQGGSQGAMILKLTRASVIKAVSQGLKPSEILERLQRHTGNAVPANVLREVREWAQWARQVSIDTLTVLRCPDRETADRVMGALKRQAERVNDTLIAIDRKTMTATERNKLRDHGILIQGHLEAPMEMKPRKKARRRW